MSKKILQFGLASLVVMFGALPVFAGTLSLTPVNVSIKQGQSFYAVISLNPQGVKNYTAQIELKYSANLLEVKSFSFGDKWMPLSQTGYDLVDNVGGTMIKTAGYPGGVVSTVTFGTVSFVAKKSGNGTISVGNNSQIFDAANANVFNGLSQISVAISAPASATTKPTLPTPSLSASPSLSPEVSAEPQAQANTGGLFATIGGAITLGTGNWLIAIVVILAVAFAVYWLIKRKLNK